MLRDSGRGMLAVRVCGQSEASCTTASLIRVLTDRLTHAWLLDNTCDQKLC